MSEVVNLPERRRLRELEVALQPAPVSEVEGAVTTLFKRTLRSLLADDPEEYKRAMIAYLSHYPAKVLWEAVVQAIPKHKYWPGINEMIEVCESLMEPLRRECTAAIEWKQLQDKRQRAAAEEERAVRLREEQSARIRALHGNQVAVSTEDIKFAGDFRPVMRWPLGKFTGWAESLDRGELWAAKLVSRLALVVRAQRCEDHVLIRHVNTVALAELVIADEAAARRQVEDMEAGNIKDRLPLPESLGDLEVAIAAIEAAAWSERGIFEGDRSAPGPIVQNERFAKRFGPPPDATLDFTEDPQKVAAELKRARDVSV
jgi:hypothetical protein